MEPVITIQNVDINDFAIVVENIKSSITLKQDVEGVWSEEHEQIMWQFVIDPESKLLTCYFHEDSLNCDEMGMVVHGCTNEKGTDTLEDSGPLEEIEHWEIKCDDLNQVLHQLSGTM
ncbi:hypothetical protein CEXT_403051 [Caerostris extrusa]|uniref:Uncharacterized protein n=1 Tax=Caerostris extrusa TaxID=172846 RepID=A0AAV4QQE7_CAEEX|nr:hypothetical protein CEXT_403051 [Caerostris extrusa]